MQEYDVIVLGTGLKVRNLRQLFSAELHDCSIFFFLEKFAWSNKRLLLSVD